MKSEKKSRSPPQKGEKKDYKVAGAIDAKTFLANLIMVLPKRIGKIRRYENSEIVVRLKDPDKIEETKELIKIKI